MSAKILALITSALLLAGCATTPQKPPTANADDMAQIKLAEAAVSVSKSLQELAKIEMATHPAAKIPPAPNPYSIGMAQLASVNWNGPVEPLVRKIAQASGYKVRVIGKTPAIPPLIYVNAQNTPLAEILRDASFQVEKKAIIALYPRSRVIEIRYLNT
ncbi:MAG: type IVB secretion system lipoprotein DotD [Coxiellaceae bacterium]|nr:MAG: type IVB secretion system lipoprotein DotD [Coxiellaceae bacterium]